MLTSTNLATATHNTATLTISRYRYIYEHFYRMLKIYLYHYKIFLNLEDIFRARGSAAVLVLLPAELDVPGHAGLLQDAVPGGRGRGGPGPRPARLLLRPRPGPGDSCS